MKSRFVPDEICRLAAIHFVPIDNPINFGGTARVLVGRESYVSETDTAVVDRRIARMPAEIAAVFSKHLDGITSRKKPSLTCDSESEAVLVAHEMTKLGWKAEADIAICVATRNAHGAWIVRVTERRGSAQ